MRNCHHRETADVRHGLRQRTTFLFRASASAIGGETLQLVHRLSHRPELSPQSRCRLLLTVRIGEQIRDLLDVLPDTFDKLSETLDVASKKDIVSQLE